MEAVRRPPRRMNRLADQLIGPGAISLDELAGLGERLEERRSTAWRKFVGAIREGAQLAKQGDSETFVDYLSQEVGLGKAARSLDSGRNRVDRSTHTDDLVALRRTAAVYRDLSTFETNLRGLLERRPSSESGVLATTVHRVKGLEWDRMIVFGVDEGLMPHVLAENLEEERRILHVAITRGRQQVVVVAERDRESPFLGELTQEFRPPPTRFPKHRLTPGRPTVGSSKGATSNDDPPTADGAGPYDPALYEALRRWRLQVAHETNVPAYIVFYNRTLEEIARRRPGNSGELLQINGIGPVKLAKYGRAVLEVVKSHQLV